MMQTLSVIARNSLGVTAIYIGLDAQSGKLKNIHHNINLYFEFSTNIWEK